MGRVVKGEFGDRVVNCPDNRASDRLSTIAQSDGRRHPTERRLQSEDRLPYSNSTTTALVTAYPCDAAIRPSNWSPWSVSFVPGGKSAVALPGIVNVR
jgi:hypothetical protein